MRCPSCGHDNLPGADYCEECRTNLMHEDVPLARIQSVIEKSISEDRVETLNPEEAVPNPEDTSLDAVRPLMPEIQNGIQTVLTSDRVL